MKGGGWLLLELEEGWKMVLPDNDSKPHAKMVMINGDTKECFIEEVDCPCKPQIDFINKIVIHNAFDGRE